MVATIPENPVTKGFSLNAHQKYLTERVIKICKQCYGVDVDFDYAEYKVGLHADKTIDQIALEIAAEKNNFYGVALKENYEFVLKQKQEKFLPIWLESVPKTIQEGHYDVLVQRFEAGQTYDEVLGIRSK